MYGTQGLVLKPSVLKPSVGGQLPRTTTCVETLVANAVAEDSWSHVVQSSVS